MLNKPRGVRKGGNVKANTINTSRSKRRMFYLYEVKRNKLRLAQGRRWHERAGNFAASFSGCASWKNAGE